MTAPLSFNTSLAGVADTTAPTLSSGATSVVSTTAWTGVITTDEGNGTIYTLVNQSGSATASAVKSGGTSLPVFSAGQKSLSFPGLTADTSGYYAHIMHEDAATNQSSVTTIGPFNTPSAGAGTGTVELIVEREGDIRVGDQRLAPHPIWFRTLVDDYITEPTDPLAYDETQAGFTYVVDRGANVTGRYDYLTQVPDVHDNRRRGHTKDFACCLPAGTHTITVSVYRHDGTFVGSDTWTGTIVAPESVIPAADTYVISNSGTDNGGITGANTHTTLLSAVIASTGKTQPCLYLYKRGETHVFGQGLTLTTNNRDAIIGAIGFGSAPIITSNLSGELFNFAPQNGGSNGNWIFTGLRFQGSYNPDTETGNTGRLISRTTDVIDRKLVLFDGCEIDGYGTITNFIGNDGDTNFAAMYHNTRISGGWTGFPIFLAPAHGAFVAFLGLSMKSLPLSAMGGPNGRNGYGCYRIGGARCVTKEASEFYSGADSTANILLQPTCRLFTSPQEASIRRWRASIAGCYMDGGGRCIAIPTSNSFKPGEERVYGCNLIAIKNVLVGQTMNEDHVSMTQAGQYWANNIFVHANGKTDSLYPHGGGWGGFLNGDATRFSGPQGRDTTSPVIFEYNTFISLMTNANLKGTPQLADNMTQFGAQYVERNNIVSFVHTGGPNTAGVTFTEDPMLSNGGQAWVPLFTRVKHKGTANKPGPINDTSFATAPGQVWDGRVTAAPLATGQVIYDDFYNVARGGSTRVGAVGQLST
jgi:hypothetical protein